MMAVPFPRKFARTTPTQYAYIEAPERGAGQGDGTVDTPRASAAEIGSGNGEIEHLARGRVREAIALARRWASLKSPFNADSLLRNGRWQEVSQRRGDSAGNAEAESGETVVEVCRKNEASQQTFYLRKKKCAGLGVSELRELRTEIAKLKRLVADLSTGPARLHLLLIVTEEEIVCRSR
jgi:putative transposase